jgi:predicted TIM-barrel fold metal-dependent hydrolase
MHIPIFDADNHLYETEEAMTKFLPDRYKGLIRFVELNGRKKIVVRDRLSDYIPNPTFEYVAAPGAWEDYFRHGNPENKSPREIFGRPIPALDAFREPVSRLQLMDEQGVERTLLFPTLASLIEERLRDDPEATDVVIHALNEWMYETWQFNYGDRIFSTPVITLPIVDKAIEELEWVIERGARAVLIRPAPVPGYKGPRSFALPEFDPFWERVVAHDILVCLHSSDSGIDRYTNEWLGSDSEMRPFEGNAFRSLHSFRPVEDATASLACAGTLSRFPQLKFAIVENGSAWLEPLFKQLEGVYKKMPGSFQEHPVDAIKRCIHFSPFWEEDLVALAALLGEDRVLFGSDYPHPEGLAQPRSYIEEIQANEAGTDELVRKIMGGNLARLMNVPAELHAPA